MASHGLASGWRDRLDADGFITCNNGPLAPADLLRIAAALAALRPELVFSQSGTVSHKEGSQYATLSRGPVPFHTDGLNLQEVPYYSMLYCERPPDAGGETLVIRGDRLADEMPAPIRDMFTQRPVRVHVAGAEHDHYLIQPHPQDRTACFLFADPALSADLTLSIDGRPLPAQTLDTLRALIEAAPVAHTHAWRRDDILILDNRRVLHARRAYTGDRCLKRVVVASKHAGV